MYCTIQYRNTLSGFSFFTMQLDHKTLHLIKGNLHIAYDAYGDQSDPVVIFTHGAGQTRYSWKGSAEKLALQGFRTISVDLRGHGDSQWANDGDYSINRFAEDLIELTDTLHQGSVKPHVVGASLGGIAAMMAAGTLRPGIFSSITLVDIAPNMDFGGVLKILGFMASNTSQGFASLQEASDIIAQYLPGRKRPTETKGLKKNLRQRDDGRWYWHWDPRFITSIAKGIGGDPFQTFETALTNIDVPLHLVRGGMSELVTEESVTKFKELMPAAHYTDVEGAAHMIAGDRNDVFNSAVAEFLVLQRQSAQ